MITKCKINVFTNEMGTIILAQTLYGLIACSIAVVMTWNSIGVLRPVPKYQRLTLDRLSSIDKMIRNYEKDHRTLPLSLNQITNSSSSVIVMEDWWGNAFEYIVLNGTNYSLISYGGDARPGGAGYDSDLSVRSIYDKSVLPTFLQFVTDRPVLSEIVFSWAVTTVFMVYIARRCYKKWRYKTKSVFEALINVGMGVIISYGFLFMRLASNHF